MVSEDISPELTIGELLRLYPGAQRALFRLYHMGGCASCGLHGEETLAQLCARNGGLDPAEVAKNLLRAQAEDEQMSIEPKILDNLLNSNVIKEGNKFSKKEPLRILDIRTREEFEAVRLTTAILFTQELMSEIMNQWPREELLVILDHRGGRSLDAAAYFSGHGFTNVKSLKGGIDAWAEQVDSSLPRYTIG